jgi:hypothetical protein
VLYLLQDAAGFAQGALLDNLQKGSCAAYDWHDALTVSEAFPANKEKGEQKAMTGHSGTCSQQWKAARQAHVGQLNGKWGAFVCAYRRSMIAQLRTDDERQVRGNLALRF